MTIIDFIKANDLVRSGDRVLCAVSGGADSMCLLHYMHENADKLGISVCAASFDHMLRGEASAADCRFVAEWCRARGIECVTGSSDVRKAAREGGMSEEEAARKCRYDFLDRAAKKLNCNKIATAHNANDNAETMIFDLTRGTGLKGLCGIPVRRGNIIRPLLGTTRRKIEEYDALHGIEFVTDATNNTDDYTRNVIRHRVTPVLEGINPAFFSAAARAAESLREDEQCLDDMAKKAYDEHFRDGTFPASVLTTLPRAVAMRILRMICGRSLTRERAQAVYDIASSPSLGYADLIGMRVTCDRGLLRFGAERITFEPRQLNIGQTAAIDELGIEIKCEIIDACPQKMTTVNNLYFNCENICDNIFVTPRMNGDKIRLSRRKCTKSLKDLFNEAGMDQAARDRTLVFRDGSGPIAVAGFGVAERCAAVPGCRALKISIRPQGDSER